MEDYAWVIEYLPLGRANDPRKEPIAQLIGCGMFTLLEATVKPSASMVLGQKIYVGKNERNEINHIKGRIGYNELTNAAKEFLLPILKKAITEKETEFIRFINNSRPISIRVHTLDLLPGIGKKNMEAIIKEREVKPFESFSDLHQRVPSLSDPHGIFAHRIISELQGNEKYYLFTKPPAHMMNQGFHR